MTSQHATSDANASRAFIQNARELLQDDYLLKIERCLERLNDEQIWRRPNQESNSIGNQNLHLCGNARQWIVSGLGGAPDARQRQAEFDERRAIPRAELQAKLNTTLADVDQSLALFDPARLLETFKIQGTETTGLSAIFHVTEHFSMHTGQIIMLTKMLAQTDLVFYDFSTGKPVHTWHESAKD